MNNPQARLAVVVPAAGVGKRMLSACPKQYLKLIDKTVLEHTVLILLEHPSIEKVVIALGAQDEYFSETSLVNRADVEVVTGGAERVDSVLSGLHQLVKQGYPWALVHDAARPCLRLSDVDKLIEQCLLTNQGGLLAAPVKDTMKQANRDQSVNQTIDRSALWHALTPQMYPTEQLISAIEQGIAQGYSITDESSAIEYVKLPSQLVEGSSDNIKITRPEDLALAQFILSNQVQSK